MKILTLRVGQLATNCYLIYEPKTKKTIIIDPGDDADYILQIIKEKKLQPQIIIATHCHFDHIMAVNELKLNFKIPFLTHQKSLSLLSRMRKMAKFFVNFDSGPAPKPNNFLKENEIIKIGSERLKIIETPGHTPDGICLYNKTDNVLFSGDTIFADGYLGRTDLVDSDSKKLKKSLEKIFKFPETTRILPGHGKSSTIAKEKKYHL